MKKTTARALSFGCALMLASWACTATPGPELSEEAVAAITDSVRFTMADYVEQVNARNWDSVARFYADDPRFHIVEDGAVAYTSQDSVRAALRALGTAFDSVALALEVLTVVPIAPEVAGITTSYRQEFLRGAFPPSS